MLAPAPAPAPRDLDAEGRPEMVMAAQAVNAASDGEASVSCPDDTKAASRMSGDSFLSDTSQGSMQPLNP